jgi:hypothetical protein
MSDQSSRQQPDERANDAVRAARGGFGGALGDEWIEIEPGIYRKATDGVPSAGPADDEEQGQSLEQSLIDALAPKEPEEEPPPDPPASLQGMRSRWRRR